MPQWEYATLRWDHSLPIPRVPRLTFGVGPLGARVRSKQEEDEDEDEEFQSGCWVVFTHHDSWDLPKEGNRWEVLKVLGESGWELISTDRDEYGAYYHFKRPLQATEPSARPIGFKTMQRKPES